MVATSGAYIVVADDDLDICELLDRRFRQAGFVVRTAVDGVQALELIRSTKPDVVLLDIVMPNMRGTGVLRQMRLDPATADTPVILFSAESEHGASSEAFELGAEAYITKPFNLKDLVSLVEEILSRP